MKALKVTGIILSIMMAGILIKLVLFPLTVAHNTIDTPIGINNRVMNADNAIKNYEWFKQQEEDIQRLYVQEKNHLDALNRFIKTLPESRKDWDFMDKEEVSKLSANYTAQKDMVNRAIHNYNAKAKMVTKNIFKDNLPSNLSRSWYSQKKLIFQ